MKYNDSVHHVVSKILLGIALSSSIPALRTTAALEDPRSVSRIGSREQFLELARPAGSSSNSIYSSLPSLMFAIDRTAKDQVYYINSKRYQFHKEFLAANYLTLDRGDRFYENNYRAPNRRFILGTIAFYSRADRFTFEFWEGDQLTKEILRESSAALSSTFFAPLAFKPNSSQHETIAKSAPGIVNAPVDETIREQTYIPLNLGRNFGVLRVIDDVTVDTIIDRNEVVILKNPPIRLTPLSGVITTKFATPLAHVNLLARGWRIPNAFIKDAAETFAFLEGKFVFFETRDDGFTLREAKPAEISSHGREVARREDLLTPRVDLNFKQLTLLSNQRKADAQRFGAKAANLGELSDAVQSGSIKNITVPEGFSIPFFYYAQFTAENGLDESIVEMLANYRFNHDPVYRRSRLKALRESVERGRMNSVFARRVTERTRRLFGSKGVFVRSSTNAEDLENFSGAGLYTTVPNVRGDEALIAAIKKVWASVWNYEAYEAREMAGINHAAVYPSVLIQEGIPADAAGVLITRNPFDRDDNSGVYINAKRGLGIRVVEGKSVPEQLIFDSSSGSTRVLTRSDDDTMLTFDHRGGIREVRIETAAQVLRPELASRLARVSLEIKELFRKDQDIEWVTVGNRIFIVQTRAFVDRASE